MSQLDPIVQVDIQVESDTLTRATFGIPAIMVAASTLPGGATGALAVAIGVVTQYSSVDEMLDAGFPESHAAVKAATTVFAQDPRPQYLIVGLRSAGDSWSTALGKILDVDSSWYGFTIVPTDVVPENYELEFEDAAEWAELNSRIFMMTAGTADALVNTSTTDLFSRLKAVKRRRTVMMYHPDAKVDEYLGLGWFAEGAPYKPGSSSYAYKQIANCTTDKLTTSQKSALAAKNGNSYVTIAGQDVTRKGVVASGEWLDIIIGIDWVVARIQEEVFLRLVATRKISYDDPGIASTAAIVQGVLEEAGRNGILQLNSIAMTVPKYADIPAADRNARRLTGIKFKALLQGAVDTAVFAGSVSV